MNICDPMADSYNREREVVKTLLEIREIAMDLDHCDRMNIAPLIDDLFKRCGYTLIPGGNG